MEPLVINQFKRFMGLTALWQKIVVPSKASRVITFVSVVAITSAYNVRVPGYDGTVDGAEVLNNSPTVIRSFFGHTIPICTIQKSVESTNLGSS